MSVALDAYWSRWGGLDIERRALLVKRRESLRRRPPDPQIAAALTPHENQP